jgi:hypothetical protein
MIYQISAMLVPLSQLVLQPQLDVLNEILINLYLPDMILLQLILNYRSNSLSKIKTP